MKDEFPALPQDDMSTVLGLGAAGAPRSSRRRLWLIAGAAAVVIAAAGYGLMSSKAAPSYRVADVVKGDLTAKVTATGTLQPVNEVGLGPEISGRIERVLVDYNDRVKAGQTLAVMDTDVLRARVLQSRASLDSAKARVDDAKATAVESNAKLERTRELFRQGNASKQTLDSAEAADVRARAAVGSANAQVALAAATLSSDETSLAKAEIKSPISGIVLSRTAEPGQVVAATFQTPVLFTLAEDLTQMQLEVNVDEADIGTVQEGQAASFTVDAFQDRPFPAVITQVRFAPKTVDNVVTYQAVLAVDNKELALRPGMTATAAITTATHSDRVKVPNAALRFQPRPTRPSGGLFGPNEGAPVAPALKAGSAQRLFVLRKGKAEAVGVTVGITDGQTTEIVSGDVKPGDKVIVGQDVPQT